MDIITYPWWDQSQSTFIKGAPVFVMQTPLQLILESGLDLAMHIIYVSNT